MNLCDSVLRQLNAEKLLSLQPVQKDKLLVSLLDDLKEARERLAANSTNSSRPPRSDAPWVSVPAAEPEAEVPPLAPPADEITDAVPDTETPTTSRATVPTPPDAKVKRKAGHQTGEPGHGRVQILPISTVHTHISSSCAVCGEPLNPEYFRPLGGHYVLDIDITPHQGLAGIRVTHDKHIYGETACTCGHLNRSEPGSCPKDPFWIKLPMNERGLVGPTLASLITCLSLRMHPSRCRIQEFLHDWLGIDLSTSTINRCIHEAGRAVEPIEEELVEELKAATLAHADETPWKEWGKLLWLWVIVNATTCLYLIGSRSNELLINLFGDQFNGWLMSDGYCVYRQFKHRLRCWAHVIRKAKGLEEALEAEAITFGKQVNQWLERLMQAVYEARGSPPQTCLTITFASELAAFKKLCEQHRDSGHGKTRSLAREFLYDWEAFWIVLKYPFLPLTNNEAERALRHWVIARQISQGTRTERGTRAFGLLASVTETCRRRKILPWPYLAKVIAERRKGNPAPTLASAAQAA